jgi:hypothetical protein
VAAPAPAAVAAARPDRHGAVRRALRLFPVRDVAAETAALSALRLDSDGQGRGDAVETALRMVREVRTRGVARVELPAGTLGLHVSGDAAKVTLSGSF